MIRQRLASLEARNTRLSQYRTASSTETYSFIGNIQQLDLPEVEKAVFGELMRRDPTWKYLPANKRPDNLFFSCQNKDIYFNVFLIIELNRKGWNLGLDVEIGHLDGSSSESFEYENSTRFHNQSLIGFLVLCKKVSKR